MGLSGRQNIAEDLKKPTLMGEGQHTWKHNARCLTLRATQESCLKQSWGARDS